jgi:organic radical activating enzyme
MNNIPIAELFVSCQMEGKNVGKPSIFVRVWGCNLRCRFNGENCDTPYAVITEKDSAKTMIQEDLISKIKEFIPIKHIVWTGGEPMLYQEFIGETMKRLYKENHQYTSEMETNGTIFCQPLTRVAIDQFNISLKLKSSNQEDGYEDKRINYENIKSYPPNKSNFKFVVNGASDIEEILALHKEFSNIPIYLMPQGLTRDEIIKNSLPVIDICLKYNFTYSPREHIILWGAKRGV